MEAARWRRLWAQLCDQNNTLIAEVFAGMSRADVAALLAADAREEETDEEVRLLSAPRRAAPSAPAAKVHDVHSILSSAHFPDGPAPDRLDPLHVQHPPCGEP